MAVQGQPKGPSLQYRTLTVVGVVFSPFLCFANLSKVPGAFRMHCNPKLLISVHTDQEAASSFSTYQKFVVEIVRFNERA